MGKLIELLKKHVFYEFFAKLVYFLPSALLVVFFRVFFASKSCGVGTVIYSPVVLHNINRRNLRIGENAHIGRGVFFDLVDSISIGNRTTISMGVKLITHQNFGSNRRAQKSHPPKQAAINIGEDVYIGANAVVLMGVSIGNGAVIGAGSLVIEDVPENVLVCGTPAKFVKSLPKLG